MRGTSCQSPFVSAAMAIAVKAAAVCTTMHAELTTRNADLGGMVH